MKMLQETQSTGEAQTPTAATNEAQSNQQNATLGSEAPAADSGSASAATNDSRKVSREDIELVQNLIERCLQLYMNRGEVVRTLSTRAKIEPGFTTLGGRSLAFYVHTLRIDNLSLKIAVIFCLICIVKCSFSMAETGRRKRRVFPGLLYKAEIEKTNHHVQSFIGTPIPPYEVPSSTEGSVGAYTKWDSSYACAVNNLPMGYPVIQQPLMHVPGQPHLDSMGCGLSSCHVVNGIPAPGGFHPIRMNSGNDVAPDAAPAAPPCGAMSSMSEMAVSPTSVASSNHFPFTPAEISGMGMDASMLDAAFTTDVGNASALQLGPDGGVGSSRDSGRSLGQLWNFSLSDLAVDMSNLGDFGALEDYAGSPFLPSDSDILLDSPDQDDIVEEYFADTIAGPCSQSDEEKS